MIEEKSHARGLEDDIVMMLVLFKLIYIQCSLNQNHSWLLWRNLQDYSEIIWKCKGPKIAKQIFKKKNQFRGLTLPSFKNDYKAIVMETMRCWHKDRL